jgi:predicted phage terminase large subunit-like protein
MTSTGDETGIVVAGRGSDNRFYILQDATMRSSPDQWIEKAISLYHTHNADRIIAEVNNGGDLIERLLRTRDVNVPYKSVRATRGKVTRAEPVSSFYERGMVSHVGIFKELESQMCSFTGNNVKSQHDDRVDALVWAITSLQSSGQAVYRIT